MIESKDNQLVKHINKLKHKKDRLENREYLIEGEKIVSEAIEFAKEDIVNIIVSESYARSNNITKDYIIFSDEVFKYITEHPAPEGILAIMKMKDGENIDFDAKYILILNGIQDPGNMGNIIRIADSLDLKQIIISENTVDPYMPKVVRSTMGSNFRINIYQNNINKIIDELKSNNYEVYSTVLNEDAKELYELETKDKKIAVIFGNESHGIEEDVIKNTKNLYIPMEGRVESLNVASSVAIVSYEIYRQSKEA